MTADILYLLQLRDRLCPVGQFVSTRCHACKCAADMQPKQPVGVYSFGATRLRRICKACKRDRAIDETAAMLENNMFTASPTCSIQPQEANAMIYVSNIPIQSSGLATGREAFGPSAQPPASRGVDSD